MDPDFDADRAAAAKWAADLLAHPDGWVIFDTETTGLHGSEIVQIGVLAPDGTVLLDTLVRPLKHVIGTDGVPTGSVLAIPPDATRIHRITDAKVAGAPTLTDLLPKLASLFHDRHVVIYNADFDTGVLRGCLSRRWNSDERANEWIYRARWSCAMAQYSMWVGDWSDYRGNYRWQRLPGGDHTAIGDCRATLDVLKMMAASASQEGV